MGFFEVLSHKKDEAPDTGTNISGGNNETSPDVKQPDGAGDQENHAPVEGQGSSFEESPPPPPLPEQVTSYPDSGMPHSAASVPTEDSASEHVEGVSAEDEGHMDEAQTAQWNELKSQFGEGGDASPASGETTPGEGVEDEMKQVREQLSEMTPSGEGQGDVSEVGEEDALNGEQHKLEQNQVEDEGYETEETDLHPDAAKVVRLRDEYAQKHQEHARLRTELDRHTEEVKQKSEQVEAVKRELGELKEELAAAEKHVEHMIRSLQVVASSPSSLDVESSEPEPQNTQTSHS